MTIVGVAWNGSDSSMQDFEDRHGLTFPSLRDDDGTLFARFGVPTQPAWAFVRPDGSVEQLIGALDDEMLADFLDRLAAS